MKRKSNGVLKALKIHRKKMEAEGKLKPEKKKVLHPKLMVRKDGKPTCFVCNDKLESLRDLQEMVGTSLQYSNQWDILKNKVNANIVCIGKMGREHNLYRCTRCEPGSPRYMKNKYLAKHYEKYYNE